MSEPINLPEQLSIPAEFVPQTAMETVKSEGLPVDARDLDRQKLEGLNDELGLALLKPQLLKTLSSLGLAAETEGITRVSNGGMVVFQGALVSALMEVQKLLAEAKTPTMKLKAIAAINQLGRTYGSLSLSTSVAQMAKNNTDGRKKRSGVAKGAPMGPVIVPKIVEQVDKAS